MSGGSRPDLAASVFGAGTGTASIGLAQLIPQTMDRWETTVTFVAPGVAIVAANIWVIGKNWYRRKKLVAGVAAAKQYRDEVMADGNCSARLKRQAQENYEKLAKLLNEVTSAEATRAGVSLSTRTP